MRILLVDDHALFRSGLRLVLQEGLAGVTVAEAASLEQAVQVGAQPPGLILLDIQLQGVNGLEGLGLVRRRWPGVPVVMLSSSDAPDVIALAFARGAAGFVSKADTSSKIIQVIQQMLEGPPGEGATTVPRPPTQIKPRLTPRQSEVLDLLCQGLSNKVIARQLVLSEFTVRGHVQAVLGQLGVTSRSEALFVARQTGLIG